MPADDARDEVLEAHERTVLRGSARIVVRFEVSLGDLLPPSARPVWPPGGSLRLRARRSMNHLVWDQLFPRAIRRFFGWVTKWGLEGQSGAIDLRGHRCVIHHRRRHKAELIVGDRRWFGASGTAIAELAVRPATALQPLWMVDLLGGVVDAREDAAEHVSGGVTRRFAAHADIARAGQRLSYALADPPENQPGDRVPVEVWIDHDGCIRRIRHASQRTGGGGTTSTVDLVAFGIALPTDWSRIPRDPDDKR